MPSPAKKPTKRVTKKTAATKPKPRAPRKPRTVEPTPEQIAEAAYFIWQERGRPIGRDQEHWQEAEMRLRKPAARRKTVRKKKT